MQLLNEFGPKKYKPYVQVLEDSLTKLEEKDSLMQQSIEEINKERKFLQVKEILCEIYYSKNSKKIPLIQLMRR